mmetsp:Transcript_2185/g.2938  ORF Transcript_2185/g.2938 Transcript_2185/m.2938 type:complete len:159 (+) Transcript_2185:58-534(+)
MFSLRTLTLLLFGALISVGKVESFVCSKHSSFKTKLSCRAAKFSNSGALSMVQDGGPSSRAAFFKEAMAKGAITAGAAAVTLQPAVADDTVDDPFAGEVPKEDLPPVWVPVVGSAVLFLGIGLLQASLGDVVDSEAKLGSASGARARKESTRGKKFLD